MTFSSIYRTWYKPLYATFMVVLGMLVRLQLEAYGATVGARPTVLEGMVSILADPYSFIAATLVAWLIYVAVALPSASEVPVQLRHGSRAGWLVARLRGAAAEAALLVAIAVGAAFVCSIGLENGWGWSVVATGNSGAQIINALAVTSQTPLASVVLQACLTVLALVALFAAVAGVTVHVVRRPALVLSALLSLLYVGCLLATRGVFGGLSSLLQQVDSTMPGWPVMPFVVLAIAIAGSVGVVAAIERRPASVRPRGWIVPLYVVIVALGMVMSALPGMTGTLADTLMGIFYGASSEGFSLSSYTFSILVFMGLSYLVMARVESEDLPRMAFLAMRHGTLWPWLRGILVRSIVASVALVSFTVMLATAITLASGGMLAGGSLSAVLHQHVLNGILQVYVTTVLLIGTLLIFGSGQAILGAVGALILMGLPAIGHGWLPAGLNLLGPIDASDFTAWHATAVLAAWAVALTAAAFVSTTVSVPQAYLSGRIHARA